MIKLFSEFEKCNEILASLKVSNKIIDYRLVLNSNTSIGVYIKKGEYSKNEIEKKFSGIDNVCIHYVEEEDDCFIETIFSNPCKCDTSYSQRHLCNLIQPISREKHDIPIITFYSYKGGVGRSTTLASCASFLAVHYCKKIVILDCDFEAPGFTNFFMEEPQHPTHHNGVVEYLVDSEVTDVSLQDYYWEVSKVFSGNGSIYVFPAGNLSDSEICDGLFPTNRIHYLNGLTRLDLFSKDGMVNQFNTLFDCIKKELSPDAIFIDSRTGFNDVYGISAFRLSDVVVAFFGGNVQTKPGLHFFLDMIKQPSAPHLIVVNSIIPQTMRRERFAKFREEVDMYLDEISEDNVNRFTVDMYPISRNITLSDLGSVFEDYRDFMELIEQRTFPEFNNLFDSINEIIDEKKYVVENIQKKTVLLNGSVANKKGLFDTKRNLLLTLQKKMPELYAENIKNFDVEFEERRYFFRKCMDDLFNTNKILVLGNKGTGKSYIYKSLKESKIVDALKKRANKENSKFQFIHVVDSNRKFDTVKLDSQTCKMSSELFYERFWLIYIWNAIMQEKPFGYISGLDIHLIQNDTATAHWFENLIEDDNRIIEIENDLTKIDVFLKNNDAQIIFIFDELDNIVKPHKWSERISPLINFCKQMNYKSLFPKLFLRSDLYEKTTGINNKNELTNRAIDIEWNREELFAYFFKLILSHSKEDFFYLMKNDPDIPAQYVNKIERNLSRQDFQPSLDEYTLRHLCSVFFGKYADTQKSPRYGESYDWFFTNLKNANGTISLRPFIDLVTLSVKEALSDDKTDSPILSQKYYTNGNIRAKAVENHIKDLAKEAGNTDLMPIFDYISTKANIKYKKERLFQKDFNELLNQIIANCELKDNQDRDSIIAFLEVNGVIRSRIVRYGNVPLRIYEFAYLYKYYLGLKGRGNKK